MSTFYQILRRYSLPGILALLLLNFSYCGGGSGGDSNDADGADFDVGVGTGNALDDTNNTISAAGSVAGGFAIGSTEDGGSTLVKAATNSINETTDCEEGGEVTVNGTVKTDNPATVSLAMDFNNCVSEGVTLNGGLNFTAIIDVDSTNNITSLTFVLSGEVGGNGCLVTFEALTTDVSVVSGTDESTGTISGQATGDCGEAGTVTCDYGSGTDFNDSAALAAACS